EGAELDAVLAAAAGQPQRVRDREVGLRRARRRELEVDPLVRLPVDRVRRQGAQTAGRARERRDADEVQPVPGRLLQPGRGEAGRGAVPLVRLLLVELREADRLAPELLLREVEDVALEQPQRD